MLLPERIITPAPALVMPPVPLNVWEKVVVVLLVVMVLTTDKAPVLEKVMSPVPPTVKLAPMLTPLASMRAVLSMLCIVVAPAMVYDAEPVTSHIVVICEQFTPTGNPLEP